MADGDASQAELLRQFRAAISGMELADLRRLAADLPALAGRAGVLPGRPQLRHPRRAELAIYRIRVDLDGAQPPIWRRLDVRSDLTLAVVHEVLQAAFGWSDSHLHRFALPLAKVTAAMTELGWSHRDGTLVGHYEIGWLPVFSTLVNVTRERGRRSEQHGISPEAAALARAALRG